MSHETWQLVNSLECLLPYTVLHMKDFSQFISLKNSFSQICSTLKSNLLFYECHIIFFLFFSLVSNNFTNYGRRPFKTIYQLWKWKCFLQWRGGGEIRYWQTENFYNPSNPKQNLKINVICFFRLKQWQVLNII